MYASIDLYLELRSEEMTDLDLEHGFEEMTHNKGCTMYAFIDL